MVRVQQGNEVEREALSLVSSAWMKFDVLQMHIGVRPGRGSAELRLDQVPFDKISGSASHWGSSQGAACNVPV